MEEKRLQIRSNEQNDFAKRFVPVLVVISIAVPSSPLVAGYKFSSPARKLRSDVISFL